MKALILNVINTIIIIFFVTSCNKKVRSERTESDLIISELINIYAKPIPPPPKYNDSISSMNFDSIQENLSKKWKNKSVVIRLDTINYPKINETSNEPSTNALIKKLKKLKNNYTIDTSNLNVRNNIRFYEVNNKPSQKYDEVDMVLSFSRISFDEDLKKAVVIIGISRSKLSGYSNLLILQKTKGKWIIITSKLLEIS